MIAATDVAEEVQVAVLFWCKCSAKVQHLEVK